MRSTTRSTSKSRNRSTSHQRYQRITRNHSKQLRPTQSNIQFQSSHQHDDLVSDHHLYKCQLQPQASNSNSHPLLSKGSFLPRWSILDRLALGPEQSNPPVHGFLTLFWIISSLYVGISMYRNSEHHFMGISLVLLRNSYRQWEALLVMVGALYLYTYICLPYQWLLRWKWFDSRNQIARLPCRLVLQNIPIMAALFVAKYGDWPHLQTGSLLLFSISMSMKMHSFLFTNESLDISFHSSGFKGGRSKRSTSTTSVSSLRYPENLTMAHFTLYLWFPTLIYELNYPRLPKIRWSFLIERTFGVAVIVALLYVVLSHYVHPVLLRIPSRSWLDSYVDLLLPCTLSAILIFFLIFEYLLNWAAELTRFADRKFYADWWNSKDMAEFSRKWNVPVHRFLRYHIYTMMRIKWKVRRSTAQFLTFLYSSFLHELVVSAAARRVQCFLFFMQMSQIPLIYGAQMLRIHRSPFLANLIWWLMIIFGIPLLVLLYGQ